MKTEATIRAWLDQQPREVCTAIAYRAAFRVAPFAMVSMPYSTPELALAIARSVLTCGVSALRPTADIAAAAEAALIATFDASEMANSEMRNAADTVACDVVAVLREAAQALVMSNTLEPQTHYHVYNIEHRDGHAVPHVAYKFVKQDIEDGPLPRAVSMAEAASVSAVSCVVDLEACAVANSAAFATRTPILFADVVADSELGFDVLMNGVISRSKELKDKLLATEQDHGCVIRTGGPWAFWNKWYEAALIGEPLPWDLQEAVALIPDAVWQAGPEAVAEKIARLEAEIARGDPSANGVPRTT